MAKRLGLFGRIGKAIASFGDAVSDIFKPGRPSRRPVKEPKAPPKPRGKKAREQAAQDRRDAEAAERRRQRDRQARREQDPYLASWNTQTDRAGFLGHLDFFNDKIVGPADLDEDEKLALWQNYIEYMTKSNNAYRLNDLRNPFWQLSGMHPDDFDWWGWRDAMGYEHGARKR